MGLDGRAYRRTMEGDWLNDFVAECVRQGNVHVVADFVYVWGDVRKFDPYHECDYEQICFTLYKGGNPFTKDRLLDVVVDDEEFGSE